MVTNNILISETDWRSLAATARPLGGGIEISMIKISGVSRVANSSVLTAISSLATYFVLFGGFEDGAETSAHGEVMIRN